MYPLSKDFYLSNDVVHAAESLIGKVIVSYSEGLKTVARIVETEAYRGRDDKGCHSFIHGRTPKTTSMFLEGGSAYVYICYGIHNMLNVVTNESGIGDAVLIRSIEPIEGIDIMRKRRGHSYSNYKLSGGPGKVCQCLGITKDFDGVSFINERSKLKIYDDGYVADMVSTPRVGMSYRVAEFANMPWRFYERNNPYISRPLQLKYDY